ncbi:hypothetical protein FDA94_15405 [Herbidospora galbida]|uniref:Uncharacterized protein n=1 Tax=Herbidospora galbida TaxID=2575442 RepID=A0A4U3MIV4_9ACTN|nr:hypothetical protein [Herbidospora galbida]TKK87947.1 hypothetical protein FDA94_15405 [Herbidospora galbida]
MKTRRLALSLATVVVSVATLGLLPGQAQAGTADCDATFRPDLYKQVYSFTASGRTVKLMNGGGLNFSYANVDGGQSGDLVWIDRSRNGIPNSMPKYPSTAEVESQGGWKQCGPFKIEWWTTDGRITDLVMNWNTTQQRHYATRVCIRPNGGSVSCGSWYVDRT